MANDINSEIIIIFLIFFVAFILFKTIDMIADIIKTANGTTFTFHPILFISDMFASASGGMYSPIDMTLPICTLIIIANISSNIKANPLNMLVIFMCSIVNIKAII